MEIPPSFVEVLDDPPPAVLLALLPDGTDDAGVATVEARLKLAGYETDLARDPVLPHARWELRVADRDDAIEDVCVWLEPAPRDLLVDQVDWRGVTSDDMAAGRRSEWAIGACGRLGEDPLVSYHALVRLLAAAAPEPAVVLDADTCVPHPPAWLGEIAAARTPPAPQTLYSIHMVHDTEDEQSRLWLHTHGLNRCGAIDLDIVDVRLAHADGLVLLVNTVAAMFIEKGVVPPGDAFAVGQASRAIDLVWLPWRQGIGKARRTALGGLADRDDVHGGARGILFAPRKGLLGRRFASPARYADDLDDNPVLFVSRMETERMTLLATERFDRFRRLHALYGERDDAWAFLVKLGYETDDTGRDDDREHLWFQVHGCVGEEVDATLINAPYRIAALREGDRGRHRLALMSDWAILCEHGHFTADTVAELERITG